MGSKITSPAVSAGHLLMWRRVSADAEAKGWRAGGRESQGAFRGGRVRSQPSPKQGSADLVSCVLSFLFAARERLDSCLFLQ